MKNNFLKTYIFIFSIFFNLNVYAVEQFNFNITEIQILENGNKFKGFKRGEIQADNDIIIIADEFEYDKKLNILKAKGKVEILDKINNLNLYTDRIVYEKNEEKIFTEGNSKAIRLNDNLIITAQDFEYNKIKNIVTAKKNVLIEDKEDKYKIFSELISYIVNEEKFFTEGKTSAVIYSKYNIKSENLTFLRNSMELISKYKTIITDGKNLYSLEKFSYSINDEKLKGEKIIIDSNHNLPKNDKLYFKSAIIDFKNQDFIAQDTEIKIHREIFNNSENDPRLKGVSSSKRGDITTINKGIFTSCKTSNNDDDCPPWSMQAKKIQHDKSKKQLTYDSAILKIYDVPVLYFPKFFHPDPTVKRQSGLLQPELNNSNVMGNSLTVPYFNVISINKDITITPTIFSNGTIMSQNEYRHKNKYSYFLADIGLVKDYKSESINKTKNLFHLFTKFDLDLNLENFIESKLNLSVEKVTNDTYLKVFDTFITKSDARPENLDVLNNQAKLSLNHSKFYFEAGMETFEDLQQKESDRFQYILPYYNYDQVFNDNYLNGSLSFSSSGTNSLTNTNDLKTNIINDLIFVSQNYITNKGIKSSLGVNLKNTNSIGKKNSDYKSSPQVELASLFNIDINYPLIKKNLNTISTLTPKASFRFNPSDMKDYSDSENKIDVGNIFSLNRLGINDTFETGKSLTLGVDFKTENTKNLKNINNYFDIKLATVLRNKEEAFISKKSTLNKKNSNLFGSITGQFTENFNLNYNFSIDNDFYTFEYNDINATISNNNLVTKFNFIEENGEMGESNVIETSLGYNFDKNNFLTFKTRRNRQLNLTEYYDLVYEYKNDCLTAGIKYKKSYYEDRDLKPTENLLFTITLFPLTTYEYEAKELVTN